MDWLNGWGNRALVEIMYPTVGGQTYYQVSLTINYRPDMQADFDDIRFTLYDGITELSYFKDSYVPSISATFWIKIPSILTLPKITIICMYWCNDSVSTTSSATDTFLRVINNAVCYWDFNESSGVTVYDKLSSTISGTLNGGVLRVVENDNDGVVYFDGINDYMSWTYTKPSNNFSISFWVKAITTHGIDTESTTGTAGNAGQKYVFGITNEGADAGAGISIGTNGISVYGHGTSYMPPLAVYSAAIGTGWNHVVVTFTNKQPRIYLNSLLVRTGLTCTKTYIYAPTRLGGDTTYSYFNGTINDVCIFSSTLTQTQISDMYARTAYHYTSSYQGILVKKYTDPEPEISYMAYTTGNMCVKNPYVFSCSVSGINVYDIESLSLIKNVNIEKISSVWSNDSYLFAGTSNSGIYRYDLSTIADNPIAEIYKQYPNITSNNIRYLSGASPYLCVVTLSGVDRYDLNTDNRKNVNVIGANKCFQTSAGDFYFDLYTDLVAVYNDNSFFVYTSEENNILNSYSIYDIENNCAIHDMFITEGTSLYDGANTVFLATAHGAIVIEEKRGDEENARKRYYLNQYSTLGEISPDIPIEIETKGYILGGLAYDITNRIATIESLTFNTEVITNITAVLSVAKQDGVGVSGELKGYCMGAGYDKTTIIESLVFNIQLNVLIDAVLSEPKGRGAGVNNITNGYVLSGEALVSPYYTTIIEKLVFSTEVCSPISETMDTAVRWSAGINNDTVGYALGGGNTTVLLNIIQKFIFSSETASTISETLNRAFYGMAGVNSSTKGYTMGGYSYLGGGWGVYNTISSFEFSTENLLDLSATLNVAKHYGTGVNSTIKGYVMGGSETITVEDLNFTSEASIVISTELNDPRQCGAGVQNGSF